MILIRLEAHQPPYLVQTFRAGLNIIAESLNSSNPPSLLQIIRFCLGIDPLESGTDQAMDQSFTLTFQVDGQFYTVTRGSADPGNVVFCGEIMSVADLQQRLLALCFGIEAPPAGITWTSLFSCFDLTCGFTPLIPDDRTSEGAAYCALLHSCYLLGLDLDPVLRKRALWDRKVSAANTAKALQNDPLYRPYLLGQRDAELDAADLVQRIRELDKAVSQYQVSSEIRSVEADVRETKRTIQYLEDQRDNVLVCIQNIEASLQVPPQEDVEHTLAVYAAASVEIPEWVQRRVEEVVAYHRDLQLSRISRLQEGLGKQKSRLADLETQIRSLQQHLDECLRYLSTHGTPEEYASLTEQRSALEAQYACIQAYQAAQRAERDAALDRSAAFLAEDRLVYAYLESQATYLASWNDTFVSFAKQFYPNRKCGLLARNNPGENMLRYTLDAYIEGESTDVLDTVRHLCLILTVLQQEVNQLHFLCLNSALLEQLGPQQGRTALRIVQDIYQSEATQCLYILDENTFQAV